MQSENDASRIDTVIIGGGQSGLSVAYYLRRAGVPFVVLEAAEHVGDSWRRRWDSLRLFTPARYDGLVGMPFPASSHSFPTKDEMADYLAGYAQRFGLPVRTGVRVDRVVREGDEYVVTAGSERWVARNVVVAMATYQAPKIPAFAAELDPDIVQLHSSEYRNPDQLRAGGVLVVGAGNSGAEIAVEVARSGHETWLSGRDTGHLPFRIEGTLARMIVPVIFRLVFHRLITVDTPIGRRARPKAVALGGPLIRLHPEDLVAARVRRVGRTTGVRDGRPLMADGLTLPVTNVIWCTGFHPGMSWLHVPVVDDRGEPVHERGLVASHPGLYFVGLHFLYALSSTMIHGVARDAERIARAIITRAPRSTPRGSELPAPRGSSATSPT